MIFEYSDSLVAGSLCVSLIDNNQVAALIELVYKYTVFSIRYTVGFAPHWVSERCAHLFSQNKRRSPLLPGSVRCAKVKYDPATSPLPLSDSV